MRNTGNTEIYTAGLVIIGNEILSGRTQDTNTPWIAERLTQCGIVLSEVRVIPDREDLIVKTINELRDQFDYIFTTGGIGPTHDDITAESIARAFDVSLVQNERAYKSLAAYYAEEDLTPARLKMAMIPEGASLIDNKISGAPGFRIENVFVMAGVPRIMQEMFANILDSINLGAPILSQAMVCDLSESDLADDLSDLQNQHPDVQIGSYPHFHGGLLGLSIVLRTVDREKLDSAIEALSALLDRHGVEPRAVSLNVLDEENDAVG